MLAKVPKRHQICQVNELLKEKLKHKAAKSTAMVTVALFLSFFPVIVGGMIQGLYQVFRQRLVMSLADIFFDI